MTEAQKMFVESVYKVLLNHAPLYDIKCYPAILGQAILESNWGKSQLASKYHNYFGMKCGSKYKGKSVNLSTKEEYKEGVLTTIKDNFRVYDTFEQGIIGYLQFIDCTRYSNLKGVTDTLTYLRNIKNDGYATSSKYVDNVMNIVASYNLEKYSVFATSHKTTLDIAKEVIKGKWGNGVTRKELLTSAGYDYNEVQKLVNNLLNPRVHLVRKGDTLNKISNYYFGTTNRVQEIMEINNLSSTCIHIGERLIIPK